MQTDMEKEIEIKEEVKTQLLLEGEINDSIIDHQYSKRIQFEEIKQETADIKIETEDTSEKTGFNLIETEPPRKMIKCEEVNVETCKQSAPTKKGNKSDKKVKQHSKGKRQTQKTRTEHKLLRERGANPGPSVKSSRSRITLHQRTLMLDYIRSNPSIVTGRFEEPNGARVRSKLLANMATLLNSQRTGVVKSPLKWLRSWQDWKSDIKKKAAAIARHARGTGRGPAVSGLTELEKELVDFIGSTSISGLDVPDPLEGPSQLLLPDQLQSAEESFATAQVIGVDVLQEIPYLIEADPEVVISTSTHSIEPADETAVEGPQVKTNNRKTNNDASIDEKIVSAMERQADANAEVAHQIGRLANVGLLFLKTWAQAHDISLAPEDYNSCE